MKKTIVTLAVLAAILCATSHARAQLFGRCRGGSCRIQSAQTRQGGLFRRRAAVYSHQYSGGYSGGLAAYSSGYSSGPTSCPAPCQAAGACYETAQDSGWNGCDAGACSLQTSAPIPPCGYAETTDETPAPCAPVDVPAPEPCAPASSYDDGATCEYIPMPQGNVAVARACPLRTAARAIASIPQRVAARVTAAAMLAQANATRARYGLSALTIDSSLQAGAEAHCEAEAARGYIYHAPGCGYEITAQNWDNEGIETALTQWLNSPGHRALLLGRNFTRCGVSYYRAADGRNYCTMRFM